MRFEWDHNKNETNQRKHGISFEEAKTVFYDDYAVLFDDPDHSQEEDRFLIIGLSQREKLCIVSHCYRESMKSSGLFLREKRRSPKLRSTLPIGGRVSL